MVRKVPPLTLAKMSLKQLEAREDRLQIEAGKVHGRMQEFRTKASHKTKAYRDLLARSKKITRERDKTHKYVLWKRKSSKKIRRKK